MICCAVQAAVGCSVIAKWTMRRRWCASSTRTKSTRPVTVGTVKKSNRDQRRHVVGQERAPGLARRVVSPTEES
jgi:hypothetical protein